MKCKYCDKEIKIVGRIYDCSFQPDIWCKDDNKCEDDLLWYREHFFKTWGGEKYEK